MKIQESFLPSFPFFHLLLHWVRQPFLGIPPFISDPGSLCLFLYLDLLRILCTVVMVIVYNSVAVHLWSSQLTVQSLISSNSFFVYLPFYVASQGLLADYVIVIYSAPWLFGGKLSVGYHIV